ncbi:MAG: hypothetical protein ACREBB_06185 [Nitrosotalea sp.]
MTVQKAIQHLKILIENRHKLLNIMKERVNKMQSDSGKELGNGLIEIIESDLSDLQQVLAELQPKGTESNSKRKKNSIRHSLRSET